jgi:hypothetical protein
MTERSLMRQTHTVSEDTDVFAQAALVVEQIAAHMRTLGEKRTERIADRRTLSP